MDIREEEKDYRLHVILEPELKKMLETLQSLTKLTKTDTLKRALIEKSERDLGEAATRQILIGR